MPEWLCDTALGTLIRALTGDRLLKYPEERPGFQLPPNLRQDDHPEHLDEKALETANGGTSPSEISLDRQAVKDQEKGLVGWYSDDDPSNPHNWSKWKKWNVVLQLGLYTVTTYGSSSLYVSSEGGMMQEFHVGYTPAALGLAINVIGYGVGPLLFGPLSEIPYFGKNGVYIPTFFIFTILSVVLSVVDNYAGLLVLRFLQGLFASPGLAFGGASIADLYDLLWLPVYVSTWTAAAFFGPALGPLLSGYAVMFKGWRWGLWEAAWMGGPIWVLMFLTLPETSADTVLLQRANRLRKLTGRHDLKSASEIKQADMTFSGVFFEAIVKPIEIMLKDPAIAFADFYLALCYGIYYSFFEAFALVYPPIYGFNLGETGVSFIFVGVACIIGVSIYNIYQIVYLIPDVKKNGIRSPEHRLVPALFSSIALPMGYFLFGWTTRKSVHWIVSLIGATIVVLSNFMGFQCLLIYIPLSYPHYAASLYAGSEVMRALFAAACVLFARPMFVNIGIGPGCSILAGVAVGCIFGVFALWKFGAALRARSTFAA
ncbi:hypothetical protein M409DRAFT_69971 [Zasmidium cellare ATCC 36951]|uniref:Major facilitator superfamily (MFS) profile domain-containing protein n=1 Tax=Zasmidium cellare ATCC 36951 TaxID=1080233 RepID=A0A6A6C208_ZASCE|nr:uncharacterized protein M409DRAFT_69971 [Zasmidium cellare ATCC 36951]KAF2161117.1 hypothetical protein M409DRAFT_69971 [Zasmidium cellare ATCC 36951]